MKIIKLFVLTTVIFLFSVSAQAEVSTFDDLSLSPESYWNGSDGSGGFTSGSAYFNNNYTDWGGGTYSWDGFAYSNTTDTTTPGYANQYSAITGGGAGGSNNYAISFVSLDWSGTYDPIPTEATFDGSCPVSGAYFTNTTYAYLSMLNGDSVGKKFGGDGGNDPDWFLLTIEGKDAGGSSTGTIDFYLADYRFADNLLDYIVDDWTWLDLTSLGMVKSLEFSLTSSDTGAWGMNTPAYFTMDDLTPIPEPSSAALLLSGLMGMFAISKKRR